MEKLNQYIKEALVNHKVKSKYSYHPKTKEELIECIKTELNNDNTDLNCIDTSNITDMSDLFSQLDGIILNKELRETLDISEWNVSNVENMRYMFYSCEQFNCDLSQWDISNVKDMRSMFTYCEQFNCDLSNWDVSNVTDMGEMFYYCKQFNSDLSKWDVSNVKDMCYMFGACKHFNCDLSNWKVITTANTYRMFGNSGLEGKEPSWYKKL